MPLIGAHVSEAKVGVPRYWPFFVGRDAVALGR
jgi:hypothetical protein